jgi:hypothetical protein
MGMRAGLAMGCDAKGFKGWMLHPAGRAKAESISLRRCKFMVLPWVFCSIVAIN